MDRLPVPLFRKRRLLEGTIQLRFKLGQPGRMEWPIQIPGRGVFRNLAGD